MKDPTNDNISWIHDLINHRLLTWVVYIENLFQLLWTLNNQAIPCRNTLKQLKMTNKNDENDLRFNANSTRME